MTYENYMMHTHTKFHNMYVFNAQPQQIKKVSAHKIKEHAVVLRDLDCGKHSVDYYKQILSKYANDPLKFDVEFSKLRQIIFDTD